MQTIHVLLVASEVNTISWARYCHCQILSKQLKKSELYWKIGYKAGAHPVDVGWRRFMGRSTVQLSVLVKEVSLGYLLQDFTHTAHKDEKGLGG